MKASRKQILILFLVVLAGLLFGVLVPCRWISKPDIFQKTEIENIKDSIETNTRHREELSKQIEREKEKWNRYESIMAAHADHLDRRGRSSADSAELERFARLVWDSLQARSGRQPVEVRENQNRSPSTINRP